MLRFQDSTTTPGYQLITGLHSALCSCPQTFADRITSRRGNPHAQSVAWHALNVGVISQAKHDLAKEKPKSEVCFSSF